MDNVRHYLQAAAKKIADKSKKPLTLLTTMAFLLAGMVLLPVARFPLMANLLINTAIATTTLSLVLILAYVHGKDIRALRARLDEFAAELEANSSAQPQEKLTTAELRHIRTLLAEQANEADDEVRRANRDKRPSLF